MQCKDTLSSNKLKYTRKADADADIAPHMNRGTRWNSCTQASRNVKEAKSRYIAGTVMKAFCGPQPSHYSN
jgi:hypothetical protein